MLRWNPLVVVLLIGCGDDGSTAQGGLRLNELQAIGTHNSYHISSHNGVREQNYTHAPLAAQLDAGARHFELDVHVAADDESVRVYHILSADELSTCATLSDCLHALRTWSDAHRDHHLIVVLVEPKDDIARIVAEAGGDPASTGELLWDGYADRIDPIIAEAWPDRVLRPADVQGEHATLRDAVITDGWPTIDATRGMIAFVLNDTGALRAEYAAGSTAATRRMFLFFGLGEYASAADAAFVKADNVAEDPEALRAAIEAGFITRTRTDGDTYVDPAETAAAMASGSHLLSSDYVIPRDDEEQPGYRVPWPGTGEHPSRCNPVTARAGCDDVQTAQALFDELMRLSQR